MPIITCTYVIKYPSLLYPRHAGAPSKSKPQVVDEYNWYMLGVDRLDQRMSYYHFVRKSVKWWRKVFFWILEVAVVNAYILYTQHTNAQRKLTHKEFRRELIMSLCEEQRQSRSCRATRCRDETLERLRGSHFPKSAPSRRDCRICSNRKQGERHLTTTVCGTCSDRPPLCVGECFRSYHTRRHL